MVRWDVVAKAHEFVAKINKLTPEKVRKVSLIDIHLRADS